MRAAVTGLALSLIVGATAILLATPWMRADATSAAPPASIDLRPGQLERGPDVTVPHLEGRTIVDGDRRIEVPGAHVALLGWTDRDYVVVSSDRDYTRNTTLRVRHDGTRNAVLDTGDKGPWALTLSGDGAHVVVVDVRSAPRRTVVTVRSAHDGTLVARRSVKGSATVLDMEEGRLVLGAWGPQRTWWWNVLSDATKRISNRVGYAADITGNRLASYTKDPYIDGCSVVSTLAGRRLWRSCDERVTAFSPEGERMATVHILSDGLGPTKVWARRVGGGLEASYTARWFGEIYWETDAALLLDTHGRRTATTARCVAATCERAERVRR
jgi:hypothetical protein